MESFLAYYFAPWENPFLSFEPAQLQEQLAKTIQKLFKKPGWGLNRHPHSPAFIEAISRNMDLATFPNFQQCAILVRATHLRDVPCDKPSFTDCVSPGEGYPFDNWQESLLAPNEPVYVLHTSQDQAWHFVVTGSHCYGWVQRNAIAYATPAFIAQWKTGTYATPLRDDVVVTDNACAPLARVGQLMPLAHEQNSTDNHQVLTVVTDSEGYAAIKVRTVCQEATAVMPLLANPITWLE